MLIIDTTGQRDDFAANEVGLFLKRTELVVKSADEKRAISLERFPDTTVGPDAARQCSRLRAHRSGKYPA